MIKTSGRDTRNAAFMDVGTNSARLLVVEITDNQSYKVLCKEKVMIRLGEGGLIDGLIRPEAIDRAMSACRSLAGVARSYQVEDVICVATAAVREASNQQEFLERLREDAELDARVVSGLEEARLIYLGVSRNTHLQDQTALFIDVGGGSTELIVGDHHTYRYVGSLQLGAIRLHSIFFLRDETGPVSDERYSLLKQHVYNRSIRAIQRIERLPFDTVLGSSGTIQNLVDIAVRKIHGRRRTRDDVVSHEQVRGVIDDLRALSVDERRRVPGINSKRADIIICGAAIVDTLMESLGAKELKVSDQGLQDGLLVDYLASQEHDLHARPLSVRDRSVLNLARACQFDEMHSRHVATLADQLFEAARSAGLHHLGEWERQLLKYSALLHDVGMFLSYPNHEQHTYYIIRHAELLGFDQGEIVIMATTGLFHRKKVPRKKHPEYAELDKRSRAVVRVLSMLLSMAESLDRSHTSAVSGVRLVAEGEDIVLEMEADGDFRLEVWNMQQHVDAFRKVFGRGLVIRAAGVPTHPDAGAERAP